MVGADGIHCLVRTLVFGPENPRFTGCIAWRGLVPAERVRHLGIEVVSHNWMGPDGHVVHYWVGAGRFMNVVCVTERGEWTEEGWTLPGKVADVVARYEDWHPMVRGLIAPFPETFVWALHDRTELARWSDGRVTLLGDACHPMLPFMAQGAAQSIEDGAALAALLRRCRTMSPALRAYEAVRKPRATRLQQASAANRHRFHLHDGPEQQARDAAMAASGDRSIAKSAGSTCTMPRRCRLVRRPRCRPAAVRPRKLALSCVLQCHRQVGRVADLLDHRIGHDERRLELAGQALRAARHVDGVADHGPFLSRYLQQAVSLRPGLDAGQHQTTTTKQRSRWAVAVKAKRPPATSTDTRGYGIRRNPVSVVGCGWVVARCGGSARWSSEDGRGG